MIRSYRPICVCIGGSIHCCGRSSCQLLLQSLERLRGAIWCAYYYSSIGTHFQNIVPAAETNSGQKRAFIHKTRRGPKIYIKEMKRMDRPSLRAPSKNQGEQHTVPHLVLHGLNQCSSSPGGQRWLLGKWSSIYTLYGKMGAWKGKKKSKVKAIYYHVLWPNWFGDTIESFYNRLVCSGLPLQLRYACFPSSRRVMDSQCFVFH